jgi:hypothetical protein
MNWIIPCTGFRSHQNSPVASCLGQFSRAGVERRARRAVPDDAIGQRLWFVQDPRGAPCSRGKLLMCLCDLRLIRNHSFQDLWSFASGIPISKVSGVSQLCWCFYFHLDCQNPPIDDASWSTLTLIFEPANAAVTKLHTDSLCTEYRTYLIPPSWTPLSFADVRILIPDFQQDFGHFSGTSWFLSLVSASLLQLTLGL